MAFHHSALSCKQLTVREFRRGYEMGKFYVAKYNFVKFLLNIYFKYYIYISGIYLYIIFKFL